MIAPEAEISRHLLDAVRAGDVREVERLLDSDADVNVAAAWGETPLHMATLYGYTEVVRLLLAAGADINARDIRGWAPLNMASRAGHADAARLLLSKGADVNARDNQGWAPLHEAAERGHEEFVRLLIGSRADVHIRGEVGWTPLHMAARRGWAEIVRLLLAACPPGRLAKLLDARTGDGRTAEDLARECGHEDIVKMLRRARSRVRCFAEGCAGMPEAVL